MSLLDLLTVVTKSAQGIMLIVAAVKGHSEVILESRKLMHSCQMYGSCLATLTSSIRQNAQAVSFATKTTTTLTTTDPLEKELNELRIQIENDRLLLDKINTEISKVRDSHERHNSVFNVLADAITGKLDSIKALQADLMDRVSFITALMVRDVWKSTSGCSLPQALVNTLGGDVDGAIFWHCYFGPSSAAPSLRSFRGAYQEYITRTFFLTKIDSQQLTTLIKHTIIEDRAPVTEDAQISVTMFSNWLRRFGPLKETLTKCSAVSSPVSGRAVNWFQKDITRPDANKVIEANLKSQSAPVSSLFIVRYTSQSGFEFAVSFRSRKSLAIEHFLVKNSGRGYTISAPTPTNDSVTSAPATSASAYTSTSSTSVSEYSPTIFACVERFLLSNLHAPSYTRDDLMLPRESLDQWKNIFDQAAKQLPKDHYSDLTALATDTKFDDNLDDTPEGYVRNPDVRFSSFFNPAAKSTPTSSSVVTPAPTSSSSSSSLSSSPSSLTSSSSLLSSSSPRDRVLTGRYLVLHGLELLVESGELTQDVQRQIQAILDANS